MSPGCSWCTASAWSSATSLGGRAADRDRDRTLIALPGRARRHARRCSGCWPTSAVASVVLVFLMGAVRVRQCSRHDHPRHRLRPGGAPLAASANVSASNLGNALGAWLGGLAISRGPRLHRPAVRRRGAGAIGLAVMVITARIGPVASPPPALRPGGRACLAGAGPEAHHEPPGALMVMAPATVAVSRAASPWWPWRPHTFSASRRSRPSTWWTRVRSSWLRPGRARGRGWCGPPGRGVRSSGSGP